jgi:hypothetical protein
MSLYSSCPAIGPVYHGERCKVMFNIFPGLNSPLVIGQEEGPTAKLRTRNVTKRGARWSSDCSASSNVESCSCLSRRRLLSVCLSVCTLLPSHRTMCQPTLQHTERCAPSACSRSLTPHKIAITEIFSLLVCKFVIIPLHSPPKDSGKYVYHMI